MKIPSLFTPHTESIKLENFWFLDSKLHLRKRSLRLDKDKKCIDIWHGMFPAKQVDLRSVAEIRKGMQTDRWIEYKTRNKITNYDGHCFSIVFTSQTNKKSTLPRSPINLMTKDAAIFNDWVDELIKLLQELEDQEGRQDCDQAKMLELYYSNHIENIENSSSKRNQQNDKLKHFLQTMNINITNTNIENIWCKYLKGNSKETDTPPTYEDFQSIMELFDSRPFFNFLFSTYSICKSNLMNAQGLVRFFQNEQQLEISEDKCQAIISQCESNANSTYLSVKGFYRLMESDQFELFDSEHHSVCQDMRHPMTHYFISSSHNSYLSGNQFSSASSYEMYRKILLNGCRCIEIDVWDDASEDQPVVYHGHTMTSKILFQGVLETIHEVAFKSSEYPVIISIENRCKTLANHKRMAQLMRNIFKDKLYLKPIDPSESSFPSPEQMKNKICIKGSKSEIILQTVEEMDKVTVFNYELHYFSSTKILSTLEETKRFNKQKSVINNDIEEDDEQNFKKNKRKFFFTSKKPKIQQYEPNLDSETDMTDQIDRDGSVKNASKVVDKDFSDLINYFKTRKFVSIEDCLEKFKFYEMISRDENSSKELYRERRHQYRQFTQSNMVRVYPQGWRQDSSNYNPLDHWDSGAQLVALNHQRISLPMVLNTAYFSLNGKCGYVLKPDYLRGVEAVSQITQMRLKILCGQFWNKFKTNDTSLKVTVRVYWPGNKLRQSTRTVDNNGFNPVWDETISFEIEKPDLAFVLFTLVNKDYLVGNYMISLQAMRPGYRHIRLFDREQRPLKFARLFIHVNFNQVEQNINE